MIYFFLLGISVCVHFLTSISLTSFCWLSSLSSSVCCFLLPHFMDHFVATVAVVVVVAQLHLKFFTYV